MRQIHSDGHSKSPGINLHARLNRLRLETLAAAGLSPKTNMFEMVSFCTAAATSSSTPSVNCTVSAGNRDGAPDGLAVTLVAAGCRDARLASEHTAGTTDVSVQSRRPFIVAELTPGQDDGTALVFNQRAGQWSSRVLAYHFMFGRHYGAKTAPNNFSTVFSRF